jgi:hypothetical protein
MFSQPDGTMFAACILISMVVVSLIDAFRKGRQIGYKRGLENRTPDELREALEVAEKFAAEGPKGKRK